jgi:hypothetical protein
MMPGQADKPNRASVKFFLDGVRRHDKVISIEAAEEQIYKIKRVPGLGELTVYLTDLYTVGYADVSEIESQSGDINCIVTISVWNGYTSDAKAYATGKRIGLFSFTEFYGALNLGRFWKYAPKPRK